MTDDIQDGREKGAALRGEGMDAVANRLLACGTAFTLPNAIKWIRQPGFPDKSLDSALLAGSLTNPGGYLTLVRWYPGYMSAPHTYATDRLCVVVSGTWWINCGPQFDARSCVPMPTGSFVRRTADTPHCDGVVADGKEPAIVAICGFAPVDVRLVEPSQPAWRQV